MDINAEMNLRLDMNLRDRTMCGNAGGVKRQVVAFSGYLNLSLKQLFKLGSRTYSGCLNLAQKWYAESNAQIYGSLLNSEPKQYAKSNA